MLAHHPSLSFVVPVSTVSALRTLDCGATLFTQLSSCPVLQMEIGMDAFTIAAAKYIVVHNQAPAVHRDDAEKSNHGAA